MQNVLAKEASQIRHAAAVAAILQNGHLRLVLFMCLTMCAVAHHIQLGCSNANSLKYLLYSMQVISLCKAKNGLIICISLFCEAIVKSSHAQIVPHTGKEWYTTGLPCDTCTFPIFHHHNLSCSHYTPMEFAAFCGGLRLCCPLCFPVACVT